MSYKAIPPKYKRLLKIKGSIANSEEGFPMIPLFPVCLAMFAFVLVSGCTVTQHPDINPKLESLPTVARINKRAGIYYSPQFSAQTVTRKSGMSIIDVPIGAASVKYFDKVIPRVFAETVHVNSLSPKEIESKNVDVVIEPTLEHLDYKLQFFQSDRDRHKTTYRITLYSKHGVPVASWTVSGKNKLNGAQGYGGMIENGMTEAANQFIQNFQKEAGPALAIMDNPPLNSLPVEAVSLNAKLLRSMPDLNAKQNEALAQNGVEAVQVTVHSNDERPVVVRGSDMRLQLGSGQIIEPTSFDLMLGYLESTSQSTGIAAALLGPIGAFPAMASEVSSNEESRDATLGAANKDIFNDRLLEKGTDQRGTVFFILPKNVSAASIKGLSAWVVDTTNDTGKLITTNLSVP